MKKILALMLALTMVFTFVAGAAFSDVDSSTPAGKAIDDLAARGIVGGKGEGKFDPTGDVKREEFSKMVYIAQTTNTTAPEGKDIFTDVTTANWAYGFITWAYENKIVGGKGDGIFDPGGKIKVAEAAKMLIVALGGDSTLAYPDGFMAEAEKDGFFKDMAAMDKYKDLNRAETAQMIYNAYFNDGEVDPGPGPVEQTTFEGVYAITGIKDGSVEIADLVAADKGAKVDPVEMVTVTTIQWSLANKRTIDFDAGATIKTAKGKLINGEDFKDAKASDIVASTDAKYYAAKVNVKDNKVTSIEYYSTGFEPLYKQQSNGYLAKPCERSVYYSAVESVTEFALGTEGEWKSGIDGDLVSYTQPKYGSVAPVPQTATMWKFRLNYTLPANTAKIGDVYTFTWTCQTKDKSIESTAVVTISITPATIVPAKAITAKVGESTKIEKDYLYEGVQFAKGASIGKSSYVIYDDVNKKEYDWKSKDPFITSLGGKLTRLGEDIFTYEPAAGTAGKSEIFYLALHDGMGVVIVPVTVTIS